MKIGKLLVVLLVLVILFPRQMADVLSPVAGALREVVRRIATEQGR